MTSTRKRKPWLGYPLATPEALKYWPFVQEAKLLPDDSRWVPRLDLQHIHLHPACLQMNKTWRSPHSPCDQDSPLCVCRCTCAIKIGPINASHTYCIHTLFSLRHPHMCMHTYTHSTVLCLFVSLCLTLTLPLPLPLPG